MLKIKTDYIIEVYVDEYKTLSQSIMFLRDADKREIEYLRSTINPNLEYSHSYCERHYNNGEAKRFKLKK